MPDAHPSGYSWLLGVHPYILKAARARAIAELLVIAGSTGQSRPSTAAWKPCGARPRIPHRHPLPNRSLLRCGNLIQQIDAR